MEFEIKKEIATLSTSKGGWTKEFNKVSWNGKDAKYDIRDWSPDREKCGKGVTLTEEEAKALLIALKREVEGDELKLDKTED